MPARWKRLTPEDELRKSEAEIQKLTDQYVQKIDDVMKKKEGEILEV